MDRIAATGAVRQDFAIVDRIGVVMAVFDGVELLDVTGPAEIFSAATLVLADPDGGYSIELAGADG